jgi:hypothetical protein
MAMKKAHVHTEARTVYGQHGRGRRKVYDARGTFEGIEYSVTGAKSRADAIAEAIADVTYLQTAGEKSAHGFRLHAQGRESWFLNFPHGGGYGFDAPDLASALARLAREYHEHTGVLGFLNA